MATNIAREAALAFHEADANQDGCLNFTEFKRAIHFLRDKEGRTGYIPQKEEAELRELFDSLDADGSGDISMDEYFLFTLDLAGQQGCGLEALFKKYDTTGEGVLDANELGLAIEDLGFTTSFAHDLFLELDDDNSGSVSFAELTTVIKQKVGSLSSDSKQLLNTLAFTEAHTWSQSQQVDLTSGSAEVKGREQRVDTRAWEGALKGPDSESLLKQIQTVLKNSSLRDSDLYNMLTMPLVKGDATRSLTKEVFLEGLKRLGFCGPLGMLSSLFRKLDADRSGSIGFSELHSWLTGRTTRINLARRVHLLWERKDGIKQLNELKWTPTSLRRELVWMLQRAEMAPLDLIRAYDKDNDKSFSLREFLIMMKKIVFTAAYCGDNNDSAVENAREGAAVVKREKDEAGPGLSNAKRSEKEDGTKAVDMFASVSLITQDAAAIVMQACFRGRLARRAKSMTKKEADQLWYENIKPVVTRTFDDIAGDDKSLDIEEFVRWLNEEWRSQRKQQRDREAAAKQGQRRTSSEEAAAGANNATPLVADTSDVEEEAGESAKAPPVAATKGGNSSHGQNADPLTELEVSSGRPASSTTAYSEYKTYPEGDFRRMSSGYCATLFRRSQGSRGEGRPSSAQLLTMSREVEAAMSEAAEFFPHVSAEWRQYTFEHIARAGTAPSAEMMKFFALSSPTSTPPAQRRSRTPSAMRRPSHPKRHLLDDSFGTSRSSGSSGSAKAHASKPYGVATTPLTSDVMGDSYMLHTDLASTSPAALRRLSSSHTVGSLQYYSRHASHSPAGARPGQRLGHRQVWEGCLASPSSSTPSMRRHPREPRQSKPTPHLVPNPRKMSY